MNIKKIFNILYPNKEILIDIKINEILLNAKFLKMKIKKG